MKKELKLGKRLLSLALTLAVALTFTAVTPVTSYADISNTATCTGSTLTIATTAVGTATSYKTDVTAVPTYTLYGQSAKPFEIYTITFTGTSMSTPVATAGTFGSVGSTAGSLSVTYTINDSATVANIQKDLSSIKYSGAGTVTIKAKVKTPSTSSGDKFEGGHYYRISTSTASWKTAMTSAGTRKTINDTTSTADTTSHPGYKGHPITVTTESDAKVINDFIGTSTSKEVWLGIVPGGSASITDGNVTNAGYTGSSGVGSSTWDWIWDTPEAQDDSTKQMKNNAYWGNNQPTNNSNTTAVYAKYTSKLGDSSVEWYDMGVSDVSNQSNTKYYIIEYSPVGSDGEFISDVETKYTDGLTVSQAFAADGASKNIYHATIDYLNGSLTGLEKSTSYTLTAGGTEKTFTSTNAGKIALWDDAAGGYDFTGKTVNVKKTTGTIHSEDVNVDARITPTFTDSDVTKYSTKFVVNTYKGTEPKAHAYEYKFENGEWTFDNDKVSFSDLTAGTTYTISARVKASETVFESKPVSIEVATVPKYGQSETTKNGNIDTSKDDSKTDTKTDVDTGDTDKYAAEKAAVTSVTSKDFKAWSKRTTLNGKKAIKVSWKLPSGVKVDGFEVYKSTKKTTGYGSKAYFKTTKSTYTNNKALKSGKTYYYKVRGYKTIGGEKVYTGWSTVAHRVVK